MACQENNHILYDLTEKQLPPHIRVYCVKRLESLVVPFSFQNELMHTIRRMINEGYEERNHLSLKNTLKFRQTNFLDQLHREELFSSGGALIGVSGMGKSISVQRVLRCFPQVFNLEGGSGFKVPIDQLVWLNIDCIYDGCFRGLCYLIVAC